MQGYYNNEFDVGIFAKKPNLEDEA